MLVLSRVISWEVTLAMYLSASPALRVAPHSDLSFILLMPLPPPSTLFPYTTLFRSERFELDENLRLLAREVFGFRDVAVEDRKSTRLNSSHVRISYAVFCLKKKSGGTDLAISAPLGRGEVSCSTSQLRSLLVDLTIL